MDPADAAAELRCVRALDDAADADARMRALEALRARWTDGGVVHDVDVVLIAAQPHVSSAHPGIAAAALDALHTALAHTAAPLSTRNLLTVARTVAPVVVDRLGDAHARITEHAALLLHAIAAAVYAPRGARADPARVRHYDSPGALLEHALLHHGLRARQPRVRESAVRVLPALCVQSVHLPLRPLLGALVDALQDGDGSVRAAARASLGDLVAGAGAPAAADIRAELAVRGVRPAAVDETMRGLVAGAGAAGDADAPAPPQAGAPPAPRARAALTPMPPPADLAVVPDDGVRAVHLATTYDVDALERHLPPFVDKETEHNWQAREKAIVVLRGVLKAGVAAELDGALVAALRSFQEPVLKALASLRTTLSLHAIQLTRQLALAYGGGVRGGAAHAMDAMMDAFLPALVRMAGFTKKLVASASQAGVSTILAMTPMRAPHWHLLAAGLNDKSPATRVHMCRHLGVVLAVHGHRRAAMEPPTGVGVDVLMRHLPRALGDHGAEVRAAARDVFLRFHALYPAQADGLLQQLPPATKKQVAGSQRRMRAAGAPATPTRPGVPDTPARTPGGRSANSPPLPQYRPPPLDENASTAFSDRSMDLLGPGSPWAGEQQGAEEGKEQGEAETEEQRVAEVGEQMEVKSNGQRGEQREAAGVEQEEVQRLAQWEAQQEAQDAVAPRWFLADGAQTLSHVPPPAAELVRLEPCTQAVLSHTAGVDELVALARHLGSPAAAHVASDAEGRVCTPFPVSLAELIAALRAYVEAPTEVRVSVRSAHLQPTFLPALRILQSVITCRYAELVDRGQELAWLTLVLVAVGAQARSDAYVAAVGGGHALVDMCAILEDVLPQTRPLVHRALAHAHTGVRRACVGLLVEAQARLGGVARVLAMYAPLSASQTRLVEPTNAALVSSSAAPAGADPRRPAKPPYHSHLSTDVSASGARVRAPLLDASPPPAKRRRRCVRARRSRLPAPPPFLSAPSPRAMPKPLPGDAEAAPAAPAPGSPASDAAPPSAGSAAQSAALDAYDDLWFDDNDSGDDDGGSAPRPIDDEDIDDDDDDDDDALPGGLFAGHLHGLSGLLSGASSNLRALVGALQRSAHDPTARLIALQELSEVLSMSTDDALAMHGQTDALVQELLWSLGGALGARRPADDVDGEAALLACRCIANLLEASPDAGHTVVRHGAVPLLVGKLMEITFIDLAEQVLQTLEKLAPLHPAALVREGAMHAALQYIDFFNLYVQRTSAAVVAHCCRRLSPALARRVADVAPMLRGLLANADARLVESAARAVCRITHAYRDDSALLNELLLDTDMVPPICALLRRGTGAQGPHPLLANDVYAELLRALAHMAHASAPLAHALYEHGVLDLADALLTGRDVDAAGEGAVSATLPARDAPLTETLTLVSAMLPALPSDGIFDARAYTEKAFLQRRRRADRDGTPGDVDDDEAPRRLGAGALRAQRAAQERMDAQRAWRGFLGRYVALLPTLLGVYAASVSPAVRTGVLVALHKTLWFVDEASLMRALERVPLASFAAGLLSAQQPAPVVIAALQAVELLTKRFPQHYPALLQREGAVWEIERIVGAHGAADPDDRVVWRAKTVLERLTARPETAAADAHALADVVRALRDAHAREDDIRAALTALRTALQHPSAPTSSFQVRQSGLVDALYSLATDASSHVIALPRRRALLRGVLGGAEGVSGSGSAAPRAPERTDVSASTPSSPSSPSSPPSPPRSAIACLVHLLHENLSRMESLACARVVFPTPADTSTLSTQVRLRLEADEALAAELPRAYRAMTVSIHGVATVQSLQQFLRPKVELALAPRRSSGLSGMLAALAGVGEGDDAELFERLLGGTDEMHHGAHDDREDEDEKSAVACAEKGAPRAARTSRSPSPPSSAPPADVGDAATGRADADETVDVHSGEADTSDAGSCTRDASIDPSVSAPRARKSYAGAAQKAANWHLSFSMNGVRMRPSSTVYACVHHLETERHAARAVEQSASDVVHAPHWSDVYAVTFSKVPGPAPADEATPATVPSARADYAVALPPSVSAEEPVAKVLQLLAALRQLVEEQGAGAEAEPDTIGDEQQDTLCMPPDAAFVNPKLTAKLAQQLDEPLVVASGVLPQWASELPTLYPFLFPLETRLQYFQSTAFGYERVLNQWRRRLPRTDDALQLLGQLPRQKVRIARTNLLPSAQKVLELYATPATLLEVEYFGEVGSGLGPTLEFYALVSREFARVDLGLWHAPHTSRAHETEYVHPHDGLFPAPGADERQAALFRTLGQFVAKALLDARIVDLPLSPHFLHAVLGREVRRDLGTLACIDPALAQSLRALRALPAAELAALELDGTMPGRPDVALLPGGADTRLSSENIHAYIAAALTHTLVDGIACAVDAFRAGFNAVLPSTALRVFYAHELATILGSHDQDDEWTEVGLRYALVPDHGFTGESPQFSDFVAVLASFRVEDRRTFLQWLTGSPRLPVGGFRALHPPLTVVRRQHEAPLGPDDYLPSVMTCVNYLKLPCYSSRSVLHTRLTQAMREGLTSFHLS
ncbi:HECT-type E3 ubiquitin transferase [Malassezia sp. CBS 17886]|nr:HECT-type E3 ubiquitin transferase [Malassezia sp. CBS 17886]